MSKPVKNPANNSTGFFGVIANPQSYLNIVYLLLAFPLGTFYFVFLVTGLSLGLGLSITVIGLPLLALVLVASRVLCRFERGLVTALLKESFPQPIARRPESTNGLWSRLKTLLLDKATWTGTLYLFLEFPLGVAAFSVVVTLISIALALIGAPIIHAFADIDLFIWYVDTLPEAFALTLIGVVWLFLSMCVINGMAFGLSRMAKALLSGGLSDQGHHPD